MFTVYVSKLFYTGKQFQFSATILRGVLNMDALIAQVELRGWRGV